MGPVTDIALSVVVPAYNEERGIAGTVVALRTWLDAHGAPYEILVVDNASTDRTREVLAPLLDGERVRLLANDENRGKGYSVRRGILASRGALVLHCDADCAPSLPSLPAMIELSRRYELVVGSRLAPGAAVGRRQSRRRRVVGRGFQQLCRVVLREPTTDLFCGFKLWHGDVARDVFARVALDGWLYDAEAIAIARALGWRIDEFGITWADRDGSRLSMVRVFVPSVLDLLRARAHAAAVEPAARRTVPAPAPAEVP